MDLCLWKGKKELWPSLVCLFKPARVVAILKLLFKTSSPTILFPLWSMFKKNNQTNYNTFVFLSDLSQNFTDTPNVNTKLSISWYFRMSHPSLSNAFKPHSLLFVFCHFAEAKPVKAFTAMMSCDFNSVSCSSEADMATVKESAHSSLSKQPSLSCVNDKTCTAEVSVSKWCILDITTVYLIHIRHDWDW